MRKILFPGLCCILLAACGELPAKPAEAADCGTMEQGSNTRLAMIRKLLNSEHPYAALAHLDAAAINGPVADDLRADILRRIGRTAEARTLYRSLLNTCLAGAGHHGLGLLAAQESLHAESVDHLQRARQAQPTDARVRSDLGYALMLSGDLEGARHEFMTALDLSAEDRKAALNLVLLHYRQGDALRAEALGRRFQINDEELAGLRNEAARLAANQGERR
ncbi:hypothetical protein [Dechloromonas sp. A34]|uniref:hypothetical protein n=1 Tax=Dechloromonas sp. A34 TaxID=447588 RepID=UPI0022499799|nr:hypothetical protein [Dechloromonas sp. A34]